MRFALLIVLSSFLLATTAFARGVSATPPRVETLQVTAQLETFYFLIKDFSPVQKQRLTEFLNRVAELNHAKSIPLHDSFFNGPPQGATYLRYLQRYIRGFQAVNDPSIPVPFFNLRPSTDTLLYGLRKAYVRAFQQADFTILNVTDKFFASKSSASEKDFFYQLASLIGVARQAARHNFNPCEADDEPSNDTLRDLLPRATGGATGRCQNSPDSSFMAASLLGAVWELNAPESEVEYFKMSSSAALDGDARKAFNEGIIESELRRTAVRTLAIEVVNGRLGVINCPGVDEDEMNALSKDACEIVVDQASLPTKDLVNSNVWSLPSAFNQTQILLLQAALVKTALTQRGRGIIIIQLERHLAEGVSRILKKAAATSLPKTYKDF